MTDDVNTPDPGANGEIIEAILKVLDDLPAPELTPDELQRQMDKEFIDELHKAEQEKIYKHDVDDDDPPERHGPSPAGGPS